MLSTLPDSLIKYVLLYLNGEELLTSCSLISSSLLPLAEKVAKIILSRIFLTYFPRLSEKSVPGCNNLNLRTSHLRYLERISRSYVYTIGAKAINNGEVETPSNHRTMKVDLRSGSTVRCADIQTASKLNIISTPVSNTLVAMNYENVQSELNLQTYDVWNDRWSTLPPLPMNLFYASASCCLSLESPSSLRRNKAPVFREHVVVVGGLHHNSLEFADDTYCLTLQGNTTPSWSILPLSASSKPLVPRFGHCSITLHSCGLLRAMHSGRLPSTSNSSVILSLGGKSEGSYTSSTSILFVTATSPGSDLTGSWSQGPDMVAQRAWFHCLQIGDAIYAIGGDMSDAGFLHPTIEKLCIPAHTEGGDRTVQALATSRWSHVARLHRFRQNFTVAAVGCRIFIIGGRDEYYFNLTCLDVFDTESGLWETHANHPILDPSFSGGQSITVPQQPYSW